MFGFLSFPPNSLIRKIVSSTPNVVIKSRIPATDPFFLSNKGYNDEMIIEHYQKTRGIHINEGFLREQLTIFARLDFGTQILLYFNENPGEDCHFTAEM